MDDGHLRPNHHLCFRCIVACCIVACCNEENNETNSQSKASHLSPTSFKFHLRTNSIYSFHISIIHYSNVSCHLRTSKKPITNTVRVTAKTIIGMQWESQMKWMGMPIQVLITLAFMATWNTNEYKQQQQHKQHRQHKQYKRQTQIWVTQVRKPTALWVTWIIRIQIQFRNHNHQSTLQIIVVVVIVIPTSFNWRILI